MAPVVGQAGMEFTNTEGRERSVPAVEQQTGLDEERMLWGQSGVEKPGVVFTGR